MISAISMASNHGRSRGVSIQSRNTDSLRDVGSGGESVISFSGLMSVGADVGGSRRSPRAVGVGNVSSRESEGGISGDAGVFDTEFRDGAFLNAIDVLRETRAVRRIPVHGVDSVALVDAERSEGCSLTIVSTLLPADRQTSSATFRHPVIVAVFRTVSKDGDVVRDGITL